MNFYPISSNFSIIASSENLNAVFHDIVRSSSVETVSNLLSWEYCPLLFSLFGSMVVGLCGIFPLLIIPIDDDINNLKYGDGAKKLRLLLSFAVGGLLGDVFLHLLPEAWEYRMQNGGSAKGQPSMSCGLWVLAGILAFVILEKVFSNVEQSEQRTMNSSCHNDLQLRLGAGDCTDEADSVNNNNKKPTITQGKKTWLKHAISGYLNLLANSIDNFTHGLAIGTSFCISLKLGVFSTFAILVHELPHEIGDFAILLKSGFSRWEAARLQVLTATAGIVGAMVAVMSGATNASTSWILPFTAGGFLHIALVSVLPELIREESLIESVKQIGSLVAGIAVMAFMIFCFD